MSPQSASRGPVERVYVHVPRLWERSGRSGQQMAYATRSGMFVSSLEFQVGSCLHVTAAVKAASHFGRAEGDHSGQSKLKVHWNLWRT